MTTTTASTALIRPGVWEVKLPWTAPPLSLNKRYRHPAQQRAEYTKTRADMQWCLKAARIPRLRYAAVELHYVPRDSRRRDPINLAPNLKALEDAAVREGIVADDTPDHVRPFGIRVHPPNRTRSGVWCQIHDLSRPSAGG